MTRAHLYPAAVTRLIPEAHTQPTITPRAVIVHSQAGRGSLYGWWLNPASKGLECHFWVSESGKVEQYVPTTVRADAQGAANAFAISIETESSVQATERWTAAQAAALVDLIDWCCRVHLIPRRQMSTPVDSGLGWHVMFGAPGPWTRARGKTCPGPARIPQFRDEIIPLVAGRAVAAPLPQRPTRPEPEPTPEEADDMAKPYTLRGSGPAVGDVKPGRVWLIDPNAVTRHRPNIKSEAWRERLNALYWTKVVENREDAPVPCSYIAAFRKV